MHELATRVLETFPYFEIQGADVSKVLQARMIVRKFQYNQTVFSLGRMLNNYGEDISLKTNNIPILRYLIIVSRGSLELQSFQRLRKIKPARGRQPKAFEDTLNRKVASVPILKLAEGDFLTPMALQELGEISAVSKSSGTELIFIGM